MFIDIIIIVAAVSSLYRGRQVGFIRQAFSTGGFFAGLFLGASLQPKLVQFGNDSISTGILSALSTIGVAIVGLSIGEYIGVLIKSRVHVKSGANKVDEGFGSVLAVATLLLSAWLLAALSNSLPLGSFQKQIDDSKIISTLNGALPDAPTTIARLGKLIDPNGFPDVFSGFEPVPRTDVPLPNLGELESAVTAARPSVVKLIGQGCGGLVDGTGFVVKDGYVATNAHVVAGIRSPRIIDSNGTHRAIVTYFDPNLDFAILRTSDLAGKPLPFSTERAPRGTPIAALGYPGGGDFTVGPGAVLDQFQASGRNIYGKQSASRSVYEVRATVRPGNSGGPIVGKDGRVVGVVFAESTTYDNVGYALTAAAVQSGLNQGTNRTTAVGTGQCAE